MWYDGNSGWNLLLTEAGKCAMIILLFQNTAADIFMKEETKMKTGEIIRHLRKRGQMTQTELADALGVTVQAVSQWESGISNPSVPCIAAMAALFGVSSDLLLGLGQKALSDPMEREAFRKQFHAFLDALTESLDDRLSPDASLILESWVHTLWADDEEAQRLCIRLWVCEARVLTERGEFERAARLLKKAQIHTKDRESGG